MFNNIAIIFIIIKSLYNVNTINRKKDDTIYLQNKILYMLLMNASLLKLLV